MSRQVLAKETQPMPTYVYETIPQQAGEMPVQFEVRQSIKEPALRLHPETGKPVRRIISGGLGYLQKSESKTSPVSHTHGPGCGCCGH